MILFVLLLVLLAPVVEAATYYVATTGNDSNDGSSGSPWRNPQKCTQTPIAAGDTCIVRDGTYTDTDNYVVLANTVAGTSSNPITIKSENYRGAVISIPTTASNTVSRGFYINKNYFIIEGFAITGGSGNLGSISLSITGAYASASATGVIFRRNYFHDIGRNLCTNTASSISAISVEGTSQTIEDNEFDTIGRLRDGESGCDTTAFQHDHGIYARATINLVIKRNVFRDVNRGWPVHIFKSGGTTTNLTVANNSMYDPTPSVAPSGCMMFSNTITGATIKNNVGQGCRVSLINTFSLTASNVSITHNRVDTNDTSGDNIMVNALESGITTSNNTDNSLPGFANASGGDLTLAAGANAIGAGTPVTGIVCNGTCDQGAFQTIKFSACEVPDGAATTIRGTWINNASPPLQPASSITGVTGRKNSSNNVITASARVGDNQIDFTVTNSYAGGDTADISAATTNITDSALIGGTLNQPWVGTLTNESCTNNIEGVSYTLTQTDVEFRYALGTEAAPVILPHGKASAENFSGLKVRPGGMVRMRFSVVCDGASGCPDTGFYLYSYSGVGYELVPDAFSTQDVAFCGIDLTDIPANGAATTDQLSTAGTFRAGGIVFTANAIPTVTGLLDTNKTELEYCVKFDTDATGTKTFRLGKQDGGTLTYTNNASVVITPDAAGGAGF